MRPGKKALDLEKDPVSRRNRAPLHLVSVAHEKTLPVLESGQHAILSLVPATTYTVIVPEKTPHSYALRSVLYKFPGPMLNVHYPSVAL